MRRPCMHIELPSGPDDDDLLDTIALAAKRNVPPSRIEKERLTGDGPPFIKDGHLVRYRLGDYRAWLAAKQRFHSTSEAA
jgi:hypothetical protein